jgi:hypothetical protein
VAFSDDHTLAHRCRGAGAIHPIKTFGAGAEAAPSWLMCLVAVLRDSNGSRHKWAVEHVNRGGDALEDSAMRFFSAL